MNNKENKDKLIETVFEGYIEEMSPPNELLDSAVALLRAQNNERGFKISAKRRSLKKKLLSFTALTLAIVMALSYIIYSFKNFLDSRIQYYSAKSLSSIMLTATEVEAIKTSIGLDGELFPEFSDGYYTKYKLYYFTETNKPAYITCKSRYTFFESNNNVDIIITAELTKDILDNHKSYYSLTKIQIEETAVSFEESYAGGEYITLAALKHNDLKYYLEIMSPVSISIEEYAALIISL